VAGADTQCRLYLANQSDATHGFALSLEAPADSSGMCALSGMNLVLTVGDGAANHRAVVSSSWQTGVVYTARAVFTAAGPQQIYLNGQLVGTVQGAFQPAQGILYGSHVGAAQGTPAYILTPISLQVSNRTNSLSLPPDTDGTFPLPLTLMEGSPAPWSADFTEDPTQPTTVTATFRLDPVISDPHQFDPYIDTYGQAAYGSWPSKVSKDSDLQAAIMEEQTWLAQNGPPGGTDQYGGSTLAGWTDRATGYYHTAFRNNRWWLISPLGNPLFYIGLSGLSDQATPITGRESMFAQLPPQTGDFAAAWSNAQKTTYVSFDVANQIRKYGSGWKDSQNSLIRQRLSSLGFAGAGKWTHSQPGLVVNPVLNRDTVPNVVQDGHPDIFDPTIVSQLKALLAAQIGSDATNPYILGWSVGNEKYEIVTTQEVQAILALGASVPAKQALVNKALSAIYGGSVKALAATWKINAATVADVDAAIPTPPAQDLETLREYYEQSYYSTLYRAVKSIDANHLYMGSWIRPDAYPEDWPIAAANCDVIGCDIYSLTLRDAKPDVLIRGTNKPALIGEFSFPSSYGGLRGFGWEEVMRALTLTDSAAGDSYAQWLQDASANPYIVGVEWFEYRDQPISGRGNTHGTGDISSSLVVGQNHAFGMVDVADRPKYDLVNKVRAANIAALHSLGLR
jgi:hypothetical protein